LRLEAVRVVVGDVIMSASADFSGEKVVKYAHKFLANRMVTFRKDIERCLMEGCKVEQAYFPALMTCIGFTEFMSGLHAGNLESGNDLAKLERYSRRFLPSHYDKLRLKILYGFRHKLAHLAYPHGVIILTEKWKQRRIAWEVFANEPKPPIQIDDFATPKYLKHSVTPPWKVPYDCKVTIGLRALCNDIVQSVAKYLDALKSDRKLQDNFAACIGKIFPPDGTAC
jgi:hypothetical protein